MRPGRFDRAVAVLPPDGDVRKAILEYHPKDRPVAASDNGSRNLPLAVWALVSRGRWWIFGLLIPVAVLTSVANLAGGATAVAVHVVGAVLAAAGGRRRG